jgi:RNA polymerase sigma-70 factor (ECF subfamily)
MWLEQKDPRTFAEDPSSGVKSPMPDEHTLLPDSMLVQRALGGREEAFGELFRRHYDRVRAFAYRVVLDHQASDDVAQEAFIRAARKLSTMREGQAFEAWIYRISANIARDHLRSRQAHQRKIESAALHNAGSDHKDNEPAQSALRAMQALPPKQREAVALVFFEDCSHSEAAECLGCAESTVSWRIFLAKKTLKQKLSPS